MKVFWSWQADLDPRLHQYLVRDALRDACDHIAQADEVDEADRPQVDHDTAGLVGTPDIVASILAKIEKSAVFVADVTPVGRAVPAENRPGRAAEDLPTVKFLQNPNVMSELGYADRAIGHHTGVMVKIDCKDRRTPASGHDFGRGGSARTSIALIRCAGDRWSSRHNRSAAGLRQARESLTPFARSPP